MSKMNTAMKKILLVVACVLLLLGLSGSVSTLVADTDDSTTTTFTVQKKWSDGEDTHKGESVTVQLKQNGSNYGDPITLSAANNWIETIEGLPYKDASGKVYKYTTEESAVDGYKATYSKVQSSGTETETVYKKTDFDDLSSGDSVVLVATVNGTSYALTPGSSTSNFLSAQTASISDDTLNNTISQEWTITKSDSDISFAGTLNSQTRYLTHVGRSTTSVDDSSTFTYSNGYLTYAEGDWWNPKTYYINYSDGALSGSRRNATTTFTFYKKTEEVTKVSSYNQIITNSPKAQKEGENVDISKTIDSLEDNTSGSTKNPDTDVQGKDDYRLNLTLGGKEEKKQYDILFVVDNTRSMVTNKYGNQTRDVVLDNLLNGSDHKGGILQAMAQDNNVAVMTFAGNPDTYQQSRDLYPDNADNFSAIKLKWSTGNVGYVNVQYNGGRSTNYMSALLRAQDILNEVADDGNEKIMIFLSDGIPNTYMTHVDNNGPNGTARYRYVSSQNETVATNKTMEYWNDIFKPANPDLQVYTFQVLEEGRTDYYDILKNMAKDASGSYEGHYFAANSEESMKEALEAIQNSLFPSNASITDELSKWVTLNYDQSDLKVKWTYTDENGDTQTKVVWELNEGETIPKSGGTVGHVTSAGKDIIQKVEFIAPTGENSSGSIKVTFNPDYTLVTGNDFEVSFNVKVNQNAKDYLQDYDEYPNTGDANTDYKPTKNDTSSKKPGFYSNNEAITKYTVKNVWEEETYSKPVVQTSAPKGSLAIEKVGRENQNTTEESELSGVTFTLTPSKGAPNWEVVSGAEAVEKTTDSNGKLEFTDIKPGTYVVQEVKAAKGYRISDMKYHVTVAQDGTTTVEGMEPQASGAYKIINYKMYVLPSAGGPGVYPMVLTGSLMMGMAACWITVRRRRNAE